VSDPESTETAAVDSPATASGVLTSPETTVDAPAPLELPGGLALPDLMDDPVHRQRQAALRARLFGQAARSSCFGRYRLERRLGAGATGVVHVAHDPVLDRRVALKILRDPGGNERERLLREARALAQVSHPNVVEVFQVGEVDDGSAEPEAFIALELVDGVTLRAWSRSRAWGWPEVIEAYAQAGRGLAAAHAHGLVHRDFKPDNAMMGRDGRVRVLDFGLARGADHDMPHTEGGGEGPLDGTLTRSGALVGTPAYMAPELFRGRPADARSDQFALGIAVYEALYGERPFGGYTIPELIDRVLANERRRRPPDVTLPRALEAVVDRALAHDPGARWPDVGAFVDALEAVARRARRRRRGTWMAVVAVASAAAVIALWPRVDAPAEVACRPGPERLVGLWDGPRRDALVARWLDPDGSRPPSVDTIVATLDERTAAWASAWTEVCEGLRTTEDLALDARARCLEQRRDQLEGLVQSLEAVPAASLRRALPLLEALPRDACTPDAGFPLPPEPERARAVEATLATLNRAGNRCVLEGARACGAALEAGVTEARALEHPPLLAHALQQSGALEDMRGNAALAESRYEEAFFLARTSGRTAIAAKAAINLVDLVGYRGGRHEEGERWARQAEAMLAHVPAGHRIHGDLLNNRGLLRMSSGRTEDAERDYLAAIEIYEQVPGGEPRAIATVLGNLAQIAYEAKDLPRAIELLDRSLAMRTEELGPDHPDAMPVLNNRALVQMDRGELAAAEADVRRAIEIGERNLGPDHPELDPPLANLARVLAKRGDIAGARAAFGRADAILAGKGVDADHPRRIELAAELAALTPAGSPAPP
jgi:tetratricopeptide (TPR) repeat protein